ncbi:MAG TPA: LPS export ABC transporter permease LptF [Burkholderiaceae bacterium]|nr:LPS export ABC transporter permease LptF [Burkholderiaceae bacterium]
MLHHRAFTAELRTLALGVFATLFIITTTMALIRVLGQAASGRLDPQSVFVILGFTLLNYLPMMLNLSVFVAVLMVLTRMYRDSEMVVWTASGVSLWNWVRPVMRFVLPVALLSLFVGMVVAPWANQQIAVYRDAFQKRDDVSRMAAGQFRESASGQRVFYVQSIDEESNQVRNVFIRLSEAGRTGLVVASRGRIEIRDGVRYLILDEGRRYELAAGQADARLMEFGRYTIRLDDRPMQLSELNSPKLTGTWTLLGKSEPPYRGELFWRLSLPLIGVLLALLALPLSYFNPRSGRATPFIIALLVFATYVNVATLLQSRVASGKTELLPAMLLLHGTVLVVAMVFITLRDQPKGRGLLAWLRDLPAARRSTGAA